MNSVALYLEVLGLTLLLCGMLVFFFWGLRRLRFGRTNAPEAIKLIALRPLSTKAQLLLVEVEGKRLLLGLGEGGPRLICRLDGDDAKEN